MIISASRRTDIPAFFGKWFQERLKEGFVEVRNPYNPDLVKRVSLKSGDVDCYVFWTRNPKPFLKTLPLLHDCPYYFLFTLTPYDPDLEPEVPPKSTIISTFKRLSDHIGKERVIWRYDPIIYSGTMDTLYHIKMFERLAKALKGHTTKCVISFLTFYRKAMRKLKDFPVRQPEPEEITDLLQSMTQIGHENGVEITSCASEIPLEKYGVNPNRCIDNLLVSRLTRKEISYIKDKNQRGPCGCHESTDIGTYNTCRYGCLYCYAKG
jgi:DNA repair photolyase